jgi:O-acetyl-ADP-ribose deacetylase (regulator of RNase III)
MANATGEVVETPTQDLPFKAVIATEGKVIRETYFASRPAAEALIIDTLKQMAKTGGAEEPAPAGAATGEVVETPTQDLPFKVCISTEGKIVQERFFAFRLAAEMFLVQTLQGMSRTAAEEGRVD